MSVMFVVYVIVPKSSPKSSCSVFLILNVSLQTICNKKGSVGAARKVSPDWSQETITFHSFNCFSIVWGQG